MFDTTRLQVGVIVFVASLVLNAEARAQSVDMLLPGDEYSAGDLPANPAGTWWVLHRAEDVVLAALPIAVTPLHNACGDDPPQVQNGRAVAVPGVRRPILLVRGLGGLEPGPVRTSFVSDGVTGQADSVQMRWDHESLVLRHVTAENRHEVRLTVGKTQHRLHADQWHGDGQWEVRWVGDLNRDGWPDVLLDASYKYSVYTTRLFVSHLLAEGFEMIEVATFTHTAC